MKNYLPVLMSALVLSSLLMVSSASYAEELDNQVLPEKSYSDKVGDKALNGFANMTTAPLEIPKSIINVSNESNVAFGFIGGALQGILNTAGRFVTGTADLFTAFIPTKPSIAPVYVWDNFDADTVYGENFRLDNQSNEETPTKKQY